MLSHILNSHVHILCVPHSHVHILCVLCMHSTSIIMVCTNWSVNYTPVFGGDRVTATP